MVRLCPCLLFVFARLTAAAQRQTHGLLSTETSYKMPVKLYYYYTLLAFNACFSKTVHFWVIILTQVFYEPEVFFGSLVFLKYTRV